MELGHQHGDQRIGAIARVIVKRAAQKSNSESELFQALAAEIDDARARESFLKELL